MRLATWNVNSVRTRAERVVDWLTRTEVDVLAMQETKCTDEQFPTMTFLAAGYEVAHCGQGQWNGVAIASRIGFDDVQAGFDGQPHWDGGTAAEARALGATCGGVRVWSLYVPNGRTVADPHYRYKLEWLAALQESAQSWLSQDPQAQIALTGDWNIAPRDNDVWDMAAFADSTHVTAPEREAFAAIEASYADVVRPFTPGEFTYWDYTQLRFPRREGMRIDFILASPALAERVTGAEIARDERKTGKNRIGSPSDHAPVLVDLS